MKKSKLLVGSSKASIAISITLFFQLTPQISVSAEYLTFTNYTKRLEGIISLAKYGDRVGYITHDKLREIVKVLGSKQAKRLVEIVSLGDFASQQVPLNRLNCTSAREELERSHQSLEMVYGAFQQVVGWQGATASTTDRQLANVFYTLKERQNRERSLITLQCKPFFQPPVQSVEVAPGTTVSGA